MQNIKLRSDEQNAARLVGLRAVYFCRRLSGPFPWAAWEPAWSSVVRLRLELAGARGHIHDTWFKKRGRKKKPNVFRKGLAFISWKSQNVAGFLCLGSLLADSDFTAHSHVSPPRCSGTVWKRNNGGVRIWFVFRALRLPRGSISHSVPFPLTRGARDSPPACRRAFRKAARARYITKAQKKPQDN